MGFGTSSAGRCTGWGGTLQPRPAQHGDTQLGLRWKSRARRPASSSSPGGEGLSSRRSSLGSGCRWSSGCQPRSSCSTRSDAVGGVSWGSSRNRWSYSSRQSRSSHRPNRSSHSRRTRVQVRVRKKDRELGPGQNPWKNLWRKPRSAGRTWWRSAPQGESGRQEAFYMFAGLFTPTAELQALEIWSAL